VAFGLGAGGGIVLNQLAVGSVSGFVAGSVVILAEDEEKKGRPIILQDPNVCRGLNTCKGKGKGDHDCAGQASCATAEAHSCQGQNACKGQGGCGENPGQNQCKDQGGCEVPLKDEAWTKARAAFDPNGDHHSLWVAEDARILRTDDDELVWRHCDQSYRMARGYSRDVRAKWEKIRADEDISTYEKDDLKDAF